VHGAVVGDDPVAGHADDRCFLDVDQADVRAVERLVEAGVAQRPVRVNAGGGEFSPDLGVLDDLCDPAADERRRFLVGGRIGGDVAERLEHEAEAAALVPGPSEDPLPLLGGDAEGGDRALLEAHGDAGVAYLLPVVLEVLAV